MKKLLKTLTIITIISVIALCGTGIHAQEDIRVFLNGEIIEFDVQPTLINDRTMVPMRKIFEVLGANVQWDESTQTITAKKSYAEGKYNIITMQIDNNIMTKNETEIVLDVPPTIIGDRTLVPVRAISEAFNVPVEWSDKRNAVILTNNNVAVYTDYPTVPDLGKQLNLTLKSAIEEDYEKTVYSYVLEGPLGNMDENYIAALAYMGYSAKSTDENLMLYPISGEGYTASFVINSLDDIKIVVEEAVKMYNGIYVEIVPRSQVGKYEAQNSVTDINKLMDEIWVYSTLLTNYSGVSINNLLPEDDFKKWIKVRVKAVDMSTCTPLDDGKLKVNFYLIEYNGATYKMPFMQYDDTISKWNKSVLVYDPVEKFKITEEEWQSVRGGNIWIGMSKDLFEIAFNREPDKINKTTNAYGVTEQWVYRGTDNSVRYYYFENDVLTAWQE